MYEIIAPKKMFQRHNYIYLTLSLAHLKFLSINSVLEQTNRDYRCKYVFFMIQSGESDTNQ